MAKLLIYGSKASVSTRRVLLVLREKMVDYDFVAVNTSKGEQKVRPTFPLHPNRHGYSKLIVI